MKQLLVLFTGGTIGSLRQGTSIDVNSSGTYELIEAYQNSPYHRADVQLDTRQPLNLLSENITPADWLTLTSAIRDIEPSDYDGILITHGSDTLAYSAVMLSYLFAHTELPIVLTASNYPIADERSNGLRNFSSSIDFIADAQLPGVFVVYENAEGEALVYLGTRITQCEPFTDQYGSPYNITYGKMVNRAFQWNSHPYNPHPQLLAQGVPDQTLERGDSSLAISDEIVYIMPYPGLNYSYYNLSALSFKPKAVLHDLHHSGTACAVEEGPYSLIQFIKQCRSNDIDVYICPFKDREAAMYSSALIEAGAIVLDKITVEAALMKLMLAYGMYDNQEHAREWVTKATLYYEWNEEAPRPV